MRASELVGKIAIRTAPIAINGDRSYMNNPLEIIAVCDSHIKVKWYPLGSVEHLLNSDWLDNNWTDYERLFEEPKAREVRRIAKEGDWIKVTQVIAPHGVYRVGDIIQIEIHYPPTDIVEAKYNGTICRLTKDEYVVLENYQPEPYKVDWSKVTDREIAEELLRRYS